MEELKDQILLQLFAGAPWPAAVALLLWQLLVCRIQHLVRVQHVATLRLHALTKVWYTALGTKDVEGQVSMCGRGDRLTTECGVARVGKVCRRGCDVLSSAAAQRRAPLMHSPARPGQHRVGV